MYVCGHHPTTNELFQIRVNIFEGDGVIAGSQHCIEMLTIQRYVCTTLEYQPWFGNDKIAGRTLLKFVISKRGQRWSLT